MFILQISQIGDPREIELLGRKEDSLACFTSISGFRLECSFPYLKFYCAWGFLHFYSLAASFQILCIGSMLEKVGLETDDVY